MYRREVMYKCVLSHLNLLSEKNPTFFSLGIEKLFKMSALYSTCPVHCSVNSDGPPWNDDPSGKVSVKFPPRVSSQGYEPSEC